MLIQIYSIIIKYIYRIKMLLEELTQNSELRTQNLPFRIDLQLFADDGEKTEKATPRKKEQARKKGQVLHSKEVNTAFILLAMFLTIKITSASIYSDLRMYFEKVFTVYTKMEDLYNISTFMNFSEYTLFVFLKIAAPLLIVALVASLISGYAQVGFLFTVETLQFNFGKLNPINGFKRLFSPQSTVELLKSIIKIAVAIYIAYLYLKGEVNNVILLMDMDAMSIFIYMGNLALNVSFAIIIALIVIAVLDYIFQWWQFEKDLKMSKEELKEEYKQTEGNPQIKSKIKQKQRQMAVSRMMKDIPKADVIIANPTHFAVALKYDLKENPAPFVVAKGQDYLALRIKEVAKENNVEIVENKPLARALYASVDIGDPIPEELYQAVAEILAFVYNLKNKTVAG